MLQKTWPMRIVFRILLLVALVGVSVLAVWPSQVSIITTGWDKSNHLLAFFVLFWLLDFSWPNSLSIVQKIVILMAYGLLIEIVQLNQSQRFFSLLDWGADGLGLCLYLVAMRFIRKGERLFKKLPFIEDDSESQWE